MSINVGRREKIYRAWSKFEQIMIGTDYDKENIGLLPACDSTGASAYYSGGNITLINVSFNDYDIMEFIGQKDINNKRMYELDIVRWKEKFGESESIIRNDTILGLIVWSNEICGFVIEQLTEGKFENKIDDQIYDQDVDFYSENGEEFLWEDLEVVGNRYQNPDLLENSLLTKD
jgi:uncharacterized phage protein (TIGR01671 family)